LVALLEAFEVHILKGTHENKFQLRNADELASDAVNDRLALELAIATDDHDAMHNILLGDKTTGLVRQITNVGTLVEIVHGEVDSKVDFDNLKYYATNASLNANMTLVNRYLTALEDKIRRLQDGVTSTAVLTRTISTNSGMRFEVDCELMEERKTDAYLTGDWLLPKSTRDRLRSLWREAATVNSISESFGYDTKYHHDIYVVKASAERSIKYYDNVPSQINGTDLAHERVVSFSDPDDDATDVEIDPYSRAKCIISAVELMAGIALAVNGIAGATLDTALSLSEDDVRSALSTAKGLLTDQVTFPVREHATDLNAGTLTITETYKGQGTRTGTLVSTVDQPKTNWSSLTTDNLFSYGVAVHRTTKVRYFWRIRFYEIGLDTLPNFSLITGSSTVQFPLPAGGGGYDSVTMDDDEIATYAAGWSVSGSLPSDLSLTIV
jgi:hypothetical protein